MFFTLFIVGPFLKAIFLSLGQLIMHTIEHSTNLWLSLHKTATCFEDVFESTKMF